MSKVIIVLIIGTLLAIFFITATDRICDKPFSNEFKQTQEYKNMQCEK